MRRLLTGLLLGIGWLLLLLWGPFFLLWLTMCIAGVIGLHEYRNMVFADWQQGVGLSWLAGLLPLVAAGTGSPEMVAVGLAAGLLLLAAHTIWRYAELKNGLEFLARSGFGLLYVGFCLSHVVLIRALEQGVFWLLLLTAVTASSDIGAFYTGSLLGRTKLCPAVSPKKTWEGLAGGLFFSLTAAVVLTLFLAPAADPWIVSVLAAVLCIIGVLGDLLESVIKRSVGVKDSGTLLAGHGGVLDRGDSLLLAAPLLYYLLYFGLIPA